MGNVDHVTVDLPAPGIRLYTSPLGNAVVQRMFVPGGIIGEVRGNVRICTTQEQFLIGTGRYEYYRGDGAGEFLGYAPWPANVPQPHVPQPAPQPAQNEPVRRVRRRAPRGRRL